MTWVAAYFPSHMASEVRARQGLGAIDPVFGNDSAEGTAANPLKTFVELFRRMDGDAQEFEDIFDSVTGEVRAYAHDQAQDWIQAKRRDIPGNIITMFEGITSLARYEVHVLDSLDAIFSDRKDAQAWIRSQRYCDAHISVSAYRAFFGDHTLLGKSKSEKSPKSVWEHILAEEDDL